MSESMINFGASQSRVEHFADVLRCLCKQFSIAFSEADAVEMLADIHAGMDEDALRTAFMDCLQLAGIRIREVESPLRVLLASIADFCPLVVRRATAGVELDYFVVIRQETSRRFLVYADGEEQYVDRAWLKRNAYRDAEGRTGWQLVRTMVPGFQTPQNPASSYGQPLRPFRRLLAFMKPEAKDIRTVLIFSIVVGILSLTTPLAVEAIVNTIAFGRYLQPLVVLSLIVLTFLAFQAGIRTLLSVVVEIIQRRLFVRVMDDLANRLTRVPLSKFQHYHGPELVNRFFDIVNIQKITAKLLLSTLIVLLQTLIGMTVLAFYHPFLLGYDLGLLAIMASIVLVIGRGAIPTAIDESETKYRAAAWLQELARHPSAFKFNGGKSFAAMRAEDLSVQYIERRRTHFKIVIRQLAFALIMQAIAATVLLGVGGYLVMYGQMTLGQLVAAELIVTVILGSFAKLAQDLEGFYDLLAGVDKLGKLFDLPLDISDAPRLIHKSGPGRVELVNLQCGQPQQTLNMEIPPGSLVAVTGPTGSGKSRFLELLLAQRPPKAGHVLLNGHRVDTICADSLQSQIGWVSDIEVFAGTIEENIRLGRQNISSGLLNLLIEEIGLEDAFQKLEKGTGTMLAVGGHPLSSGLAIRMLLIRALAGSPALLVVDGMLDRLSDRDMVDVINRLKKFKSNTTIFIATGRETLAAEADIRIELGSMTSA